MQNDPGQKQDGFSLLEIIISMTIGLIILAAISTTFITQRKIYDSQEQQIGMTQTVRAALDMISREVMMAGYDPTGNLQREDDTTSDYAGLVYHANIIEIRADLDEDGIIVVAENGSTNPDDWDYDGSNERIVYKLEGGVLKRETNGAGGFQQFAENVTSFDLVYMDGNGNRGITDSEKIRQIEIGIEVETKDPAVGGGYKSEKLVSVIEVRNLGLEIPAA